MVWWMYLVGAALTAVAFTDGPSDLRKKWRYAAFLALTWPASVPVVAVMAAGHILMKKAQ